MPKRGGNNTSTAAHSSTRLDCEALRAPSRAMESAHRPQRTACSGHLLCARRRDPHPASHGASRRSHGVTRCHVHCHVQRHVQCHGHGALESLDVSLKLTSLTARRAEVIVQTLGSPGPCMHSALHTRQEGGTLHHAGTLRWHSVTHLSGHRRALVRRLHSLSWA